MSKGAYVGPGTPLLDAIERAQVTIDYPHRNIHAGKHFIYSRIDTLNSGISHEIRISVPNTKRAHFVYEVTGTLVTTVSLYETTTRTLGTPVTAYNNNRTSATVPVTGLFAAPSGGAVGTLIDTISFGTGVGGGRSFNVRNDSEWILFNNQYLFVVTSGTNNNLISTRFLWYEP